MVTAAPITTHTETSKPGKTLDDPLLSYYNVKSILWCTDKPNNLVLVFAARWKYWQQKCNTTTRWREEHGNKHFAPLCGHACSNEKKPPLRVRNLSHSPCRGRCARQMHKLRAGTDDGTGKRLKTVRTTPLKCRQTTTQTRKHPCNLFFFGADCIFYAYPILCNAACVQPMAHKQGTALLVIQRSNEKYENIKHHHNMVVSFFDHPKITREESRK